MSSVITTKRQLIAQRTFLSGIIIFACGLPLSMFLMSLGQLIALIGWCIYPDYLNRIKRFFSNKVAWSFVIIYLIHLAGMLWTSDINAGLKDLRIKFPLFILPFMFASFVPFSKRQFHIILLFFLAAVLLSSFISTAVWLGFTKKQITDSRQISIFISHIRLGLFVVMGIFCSIYFIVYTEIKKTHRLLLAILIVWLFAFLLILESVTALVVILLLLSGYSLWHFVRRKMYWPLLLVIAATVSTLLYFGSFALKMHSGMTAVAPDTNHLEKQTKYGHPYIHNFDKRFIENGQCNSVYFCYEEMLMAWPKRSTLDLNGNDKRGNQLNLTLTRYLTSKGLRKDYDGVMALTDADIKNIENGIPSINRVQYGKLRGRIFEIVWELNNFSNTGEASGSSVSQRLIYWKASLQIISENMVYGVGTGDNQNAFNAYYDKVHSTLTPDWRLRSHNQYLAIGVSFGVAGLIIFLICLFYPISIKQNRNNFLYVTFFGAMILSFINEDTMETQAGISFVMFFSMMYLFPHSEE